MYEEHFGFERRPFAVAPDPDLLVWSDAHLAARGLLREALTGEAPLALVAAAPGLGKTSLLRDLLHHLPEGLTVGPMSCIGGDRISLLDWAALAFGLETDGTEAAVEAALDAFIAEEVAAGQTVVFACDEAQGLSSRQLGDLAWLIERHSAPRPRFRAVLLGHPELVDNVSASRLRDLARSAPLARLRPLGADETARYIAERISRVGGRRTLFSADACDAIARASGGAPRSINILSDRALQLAWREGAETVDGAAALAATEPSRFAARFAGGAAGRRGFGTSFSSGVAHA